MRPGAFLVMMSLLAGGCATTQARTAAAADPLMVPPVPARVLVPEIEEVALPSMDEAAATPARPAPARDPKTPEKTEGRSEGAPPPAPPVRAEDTPRVRTPQTANDEQAEGQVRAIMARAQATLNNVDYRALSQAARQQYDTAKRFINQANSALTIRNYVFARNLADKADTLARQLGK